MSAPAITPKLFKLEGNNLKTRAPTTNEGPMNLLIMQLLQQIPGLSTQQIRPEQLGGQNAQPDFRGIGNGFGSSNLNNNVAQGNGGGLF